MRCYAMLCDAMRWLLAWCCFAWVEVFALPLMKVADEGHDTYIDPEVRRDFFGRFGLGYVGAFVRGGPLVGGWLTRGSNFGDRF